MRISFVIPVYNEEEALSLLYDKLTAVIDKHKLDYEIIFIDDGSVDKSFEVLKEFSLKDNNIKIIQFARNYGQTAAVVAGFQYSTGDYVVTLDADLQNDPKDIPKLIAKTNEGYDIVSGWRKNRQDSMTKKIPSFFANKIISCITGLKLHDYGCSLKIYNRKFIDYKEIYGEMHRFLPLYGKMKGAKITEIEVNHHSRKFGKSKYGLERTFKVIMDIMTNKFLMQYSTKPLYFFGAIAFFLFVLSSIVAGVTLVYRFIFGIPGMNLITLLLLFIFLSFMGINFLLLGLLSELLIRIYFKDKMIFTINKIVVKD